MIEHGPELWKWLKKGAYFHVCGDARRIAADVDKALKQIVTQHGDRDGAAYVTEMTKSGRYQRDVYRISGRKQNRQ